MINNKPPIDDFGWSEWGFTRRVLTITTVLLLCGISLHDKITNPSDYHEPTEQCLSRFQLTYIITLEGTLAMPR
jgi:hypothetical protein